MFDAKGNFMTRPKIWLLGITAVVLLCAYPSLEEKYGYRIRKHLHGDSSSYSIYFAFGRGASIRYRLEALKCLSLEVDDLVRQRRHVDDLESGKVELSDSERKGELPHSISDVCTTQNESVAMEEALKKSSIEDSDALAFKDGWRDYAREVRQARK
jgi:hypothetical protein